MAIFPPSDIWAETGSPSPDTRPYGAASPRASLGHIGEGISRTDKGDRELSSAKALRNFIYLLCGLTILACMAAIALTKGSPFGTTAWLPPIFTYESIALIAFGLSWMVKGRLLPILREKSPQQSAA